MAELKRILLAEDNAKDVELALAALEENHLANDVVVVRDGEEALQYLRREGAYSARAEGHPAVILLDLKMPKVDGLEVLRTVKADELLKSIPVVMLTSSREERDLIASYKLGVNAYVVKPVDFAQFVDAVKNLGVFWAILNEPPIGSVKKAVTTPIRILHLEDNPNDAELIAAHLHSGKLPCAIERAKSEKEFAAALAHEEFDVILADNTGPTFDGYSALTLARGKQPSVPFIFLTGANDPDAAAQAIKSGAAGYIQKDRLVELVPCIRQALSHRPGFR